MKIYLIIGLIKAIYEEIMMIQSGEKDEILKDFDAVTATILDVGTFIILTLAWPIFVVRNIVNWIRGIRIGIVIEKEEP